MLRREQNKTRGRKEHIPQDELRADVEDVLRES